MKPLIEQPIQLYAPEELKSHITLGYISFDLYDGLYVKIKGQEPHRIVKCNDGETYIHCIGELEGGICRDPWYPMAQEDTYVPGPL